MLGPLDVAWAADGQKQVLVLYSTRRDAQISVVGDRELPRILDEGLTEGLDYYSEYIDQARFPDPEYKAAFRDFLRLKYRGSAVRPRHRDAGHRRCSSSTRRDRVVSRHADRVLYRLPAPFAALANSTGVVAEVDLRADGGLVAEACSPMSGRSSSSAGGPGDKDYERRAREQFRSFEPRLTVTYLSGLPTKELEARLAALPEHSHRLLRARHPGWRRRELPPVGVPGPRRSRGQRTDVLLGRLRDGPRHRWRQPEEPGGGDRRGRQAGAPGASRGIGRQHPDRPRPI